MEKNRRILIVDDNEQLRNALKDVFTHNGILAENIELAADGMEALIRIIPLSQSSFDLIISNVKMPKIDGVELVERLLSLNNITPIIIVSGIMNDELEAALYKKGVFKCFTKPIDLIQLLLSTSAAFEEYDLRSEKLEKQ